MVKDDDEPPVVVIIVVVIACGVVAIALICMAALYCNEMIMEEGSSDKGTYVRAAVMCNREVFIS